MSTYPLDTLIQKWGRGDLTVEQVIGQMLLHLRDLQEAMLSLERQGYRRPQAPADEEDSETAGEDKGGKET